MQNIITPENIKTSSAQLFQKQALMFEEARLNSLHAEPEIAIHTVKDGSAHGIPIACLEMRFKDSEGKQFRGTWCCTVRMLKNLAATLSG